MSEIWTCLKYKLLCVRFSDTSGVWNRSRRDSNPGRPGIMCAHFLQTTAHTPSFLFTLNVWNPNVWISALSKVVPFPNSSDFSQCLKSEQFCSDFRCSVDRLDQPDVRILDVYSSTITKRSNLPNGPKSESLKSELNFVRFSKPNVLISDICCIVLQVRGSPLHGSGSVLRPDNGPVLHNSSRLLSSAHRVGTTVLQAGCWEKEQSGPQLFTFHHLHCHRWFIFLLLLLINIFNVQIILSRIPETQYPKSIFPSSFSLLPLLYGGGLAGKFLLLACWHWSSSLATTLTCYGVLCCMKSSGC